MGEHSEKYSKKVCLLTGSGGVLGNEICKNLYKNFDIVAVYRKRHPEINSQVMSFFDPLNTMGNEQNEHSVFAIKADLLIESDLNRIVELALARYKRIDIVINCAGIYLSGSTLTSNFFFSSLEAQFQINTFVPAKLALLVAQYYWKHNPNENREYNRNVINISSTASNKVYHNSGQAGYGASKAALNYLTMSMADEFKQIGIRVNAIAPNSFPSITTIDNILSVLNYFIASPDTGVIRFLDGN